ncbi:MAG TPA: carboxypeptidase-like regulatory domain-containing protein, partial [Paludibacter sp.]
MKQIFFFRFSLVVMFLFPSIMLHAQASVEGRVFDKKNKEPLTGATILIEGTSKGTTADIDGNFQLIGLVSGKYNLLVSYVSYNKQRIPNVTVEKGIVTRLDI